MMKKTSLLRTVNLLIAIAFAVLALSSAAARIAPDVSETAFEIHEYTGYVFVVLTILHITLNWTWIKANFFKKTSK
jgi:cytochrome b561